MTDSQAQETFSIWYGEHKDDLNDKRREAYASNAGLRKKIRKQVRKYRADRKAGRKISRTYQRRLVNRMVEVHGTCYVADLLGISAQTLLNWEGKKWIPKPVFNERHRLYTDEQVHLIQLLVDVLKGVPSRIRQQAPHLKETVEFIHANWR